MVKLPETKRVFQTLIILLLILISCDTFAQYYIGAESYITNHITVSRRPIETTHTYGGRVIDKRYLYNPYAEAIFGIPFDPDTYTYQYYYTPPYGHNSPYLSPPDLPIYNPTPIYAPSASAQTTYSPYAEYKPTINTSKTEEKTVPGEILSVVTSTIDKLARDLESNKDNKRPSIPKTRRIRVGDWSGDISINSSGYGNVYLSNTKGEKITGYFNRFGNSTRYNLQYYAGGKSQNWSGSGNTYSSGSSIYISSSNGKNISGYASSSGNTNYYNYTYDSSQIRVQINKTSPSSDMYSIYTTGKENLSGYIH